MVIELLFMQHSCKLYSYATQHYNLTIWGWTKFLYGRNLIIFFMLIDSFML